MFYFEGLKILPGFYLFKYFSFGNHKYLRRFLSKFIGQIYSYGQCVNEVIE